MSKGTALLKFLLLLTCISAPIVLGQEGDERETAASAFNDVRRATSAHKDLWNDDLYAPMLLVRRDTREIYANAPDSGGILRKAGSIYAGILPTSVNISNTSLHWSGEDWAMIMLPLPEDRADRLTLLAHELFHRAQPHLGFHAANPDNNHLDKKEGRITLRLELAALSAALRTSTPEEGKKCITDALTFRAYRHALFPGSDSTENLLESNEGIAEYTGVMMSGRNAEEMDSHFQESLRRFLNDQTFVRSFAYETIPIYGYLLSRTNKDWNKDLTSTTNLTGYFASAFGIQIPGDLKAAAAAAANLYGGPKINSEETAREAAIAKLVAQYRNTFIDQPHLDIPLRNMNMSFDYRSIMPLGTDGTVYPEIRITDNWGILTVTKGGLMSPQWNNFTVSAPLQISDSAASGDGWTLELKPGYRVRKDSAGKNFLLSN